MCLYFFQENINFSIKALHFIQKYSLFCKSTSFLWIVLFHFPGRFNKSQLILEIRLCFIEFITSNIFWIISWRFRCRRNTVDFRWKTSPKWSCMWDRIFYLKTHKFRLFFMVFHGFPPLPTLFLANSFTPKHINRDFCLIFRKRKTKDKKTTLFHKFPHLRWPRKQQFENILKSERWLAGLRRVSIPFSIFIFLFLFSIFYFSFTNLFIGSNNINSFTLFH